MYFPKELYLSPSSDPVPICLSSSFLPCFVSDAVADKEKIENEENERTSAQAELDRSRKHTLTTGGQHWQKNTFFDQKWRCFISFDYLSWHLQNMLSEFGRLCEEKKPKTDSISIFLAAEEGSKMKKEDGGKWEDALQSIVCRIEFKSVQREGLGSFLVMMVASRYMSRSR